ncbi:MAG TPA: type II secretion system protein [Bryobacteraceae bacterium]|nr:type II secretion system protein [Bryobacteraceae bacterium]
MKRSGMTLIELLIAVSLVSLLSVGMLFSIRVGLGALEGTQRSVTDTRRVLGAQKILELQLSSLLPLRANCVEMGGVPGGPRMLFTGEATVLRFVTGYSLEGAMRGTPQLVELWVAPGERGLGARLLMNEIPWRGAIGAGPYCGPPPAPGPMPSMAFQTPQQMPSTFVLADRIGGARFFYREPGKLGDPSKPWMERWPRMDLWPDAVRVEIVPGRDQQGQNSPVGVTARLGFIKPPGEQYAF